MQTLPILTDPVFVPKAQYGPLDRFMLGLIRDERDLPFVYLSLKITFFMMALGVAMYIPGIPGWLFALMAVGYTLMNNFVFKGPFGLMLHCTSHRKFFKKEYELFNHYLPWIVSPFFGQTPETYASHHVGMHHAENNLPEDESSTMKYQRDSFRDWLRYFGDFLLLGLYRTVGYFRRHNRPTLITKMVRGEALFYLLCIALCFVNWQATLFVFILPFFISRFIMMLGNWTQHAFIDHTDPGNHYKNSITCINHKYNHKCWNDGYHISHHIRPTMHWTEHPRHLQENTAEYVRNKALIFDKLDFLGIFVLLMNKRYDKLADHLVNLGAWASKEEMIATMKERTRRFSPEEVTAFA
ncbi:MAG: fatty acid desaturase [Bacteroidetes bacterium]|nr:fatty acid desaturase [Bacteroidota bacterium]